MRWMVLMIIVLMIMAIIPTNLVGAQNHALGSLRTSMAPMHADRLVMRRLEFTDVTAVGGVEEGMLKLRDMRADVYGGIATGEIDIRLDNGDITFRLSVENADVEEFLKRWAGMASPEYSGKIDGRIELHFPDSFVAKLTGRAEATVRDGNLLSMPWLAQVFLGNPAAKKGNDWVRARVSIGDRAAYITELLAEGPSMKVTGTARIGFNGMVDGTFYPYTTPLVLKAVPLLGDVLTSMVGSVTSRVARMRVSGHISSPLVWMDPGAQSGDAPPRQ